MYKDFIDYTKEQQVKYIIDLISNNESIDEIEHLTELYESTNNSIFEVDKLKYLFAFLKYTDINQAISLYDSLLDEKRGELIEVIKSEHIHLHKLVEIHKIIQDMTAVNQIIYS